MKRADKRTEVGAKGSVKKKLVRSMLKWPGHVERMGDENWQRDQTSRMWRKRQTWKTEIAMGGLRYNRSERVRRRMEQNTTEGVGDC